LCLSEDDLGALAFLDLTLKVLIGLAKVGRPLSHLMFEAIICLYQRTSGRGLGCLRLPAVGEIEGEQKSKSACKCRNDRCIPSGRSGRGQI
jgi:hypothetical protein